MITFPAPAKINLFLHVVGRRADGFHLLQSVFRLLDFGDSLGISLRRDSAIRRVNQITGVPEDNDLAIRAARLLQSETACKLGANIQLEKRIPMGGGLAGGSSDAATVLLALNRLWHLDLPRKQLITLGLKLGADVPFFIFGRNAWVEGIGERLQAISLAPACYAIFTPPVQVATAMIFAQENLTRDTLPARMSAFSGGFGCNDLEPVVCDLYPEVASSLDWLKQFGDARMSGSGASIFVEVPDIETAKQLVVNKPAGIRGFAATGIDQHPLYGNTSE